MKFGIFLLLISFIAITVFGFATVGHAETDAHRGCINATLVSTSCPSPIASLFPAASFQTLHSLFVIAFGLSRAIPSPQAEQRTRWLSLHENSPAHA